MRSSEHKKEQSQMPDEGVPFPFGRSETVYSNENGPMQMNYGANVNARPFDGKYLTGVILILDTENTATFNSGSNGNSWSTNLRQNRTKVGLNNLTRRNNRDVSINSGGKR